MTDKVINERISTILDMLTIADQKTTDELMIMLIEYVMTNGHWETKSNDLAAELLMLLITADQDKNNLLDSYE